MDDGLTWLGLSTYEVQVLLAIIDAQEISSTDLAGRLGSSKAAVSRAFCVLKGHGLVSNSPGRRPSLVFLNPEAPTSLQRLSTQARERHEEIEDAFRDAEKHISLAAAAQRDRGRPFYEDSRSQLRFGTSTHDEVIVDAKQRVIRCAARLLVATRRDLDELCLRSWPGTQVRSTNDPLPPLVIADRERVGTDYSGPEGIRRGWSHDARHVRAAQELFDHWWERATPGPTKPPRVTVETPLDEWDDFEGLDPDDELFLPDSEREK